MAWRQRWFTSAAELVARAREAADAVLGLEDAALRVVRAEEELVVEISAADQILSALPMSKSAT